MPPVKKMCSYASPRISSEYMDCACVLTYDQYSKCAYNCQYCFGVQFKSCNPSTQKVNGELTINNVDRLIKIFKGEIPDNPYYKSFLSKRFLFHWGGITEPFCHLEKKLGVGYKLLETLADLKYPTLFSSKGYSLFLTDPAMKKYRDLFEKNAPYKNFSFAVSIVTNSDETSLQIEPNTPTTTERLKGMKILSDMGYWTILRLRPFIIGMTDIGLEELLTRAKEAGAKAISTEFFALDERILKNLEDRTTKINELVGFDIVKYLKTLSPSERGTYLRGNREIKEPYVKRMYLKCKELGLQLNISDPDFKELNESGCCCGQPDEFPENPEMVNYSRGQLTYHLKELRKRYWASNGKDKYLYFKDVEKDIFNNWVHEPRYRSDSIKYWQTDYSIIDHPYWREIVETWNSTTSPACPYYYFNGKIKPVGKDEREFLIYEYIPSEYEFRWKKEGLF